MRKEGFNPAPAQEVEAPVREIDWGVILDFPVAQEVQVSEEPTLEQLQHLPDLLATGELNTDDPVLQQLADEDESVRYYIVEATVTPLLTAEDEAEIGWRMKVGRKAKEELIEKGISLKHGQELEKLRQDGVEAREHLILSNTRLVISIAKRYMHKTRVPFIDLIQEGNLGLIRAADGFDVEKGFRFSTYATWWIRRMVSMAAKKQWNFSISEKALDAATEVFHLEETMKDDLGRNPDDEEVMAVTGLSRQDLWSMRAVTRGYGSLETVPEGIAEGARPLLGGEDIGDDRTLRPTEWSALGRVTREEMEKVRNNMKVRWSQIFKMRFVEGRTLEEIGERYGVTREAIRQGVEAILRHVKKNNPDFWQSLVEDYLV